MKAISEQREKIALICCLKVKAKIIDEARHVSNDFFFLFLKNSFALDPQIAFESESSQGHRSTAEQFRFLSGSQPLATHASHHHICTIFAPPLGQRAAVPMQGHFVRRHSYTCMHLRMHIHIGVHKQKYTTNQQVAVGKRILSFQNQTI